MRFSMIIPFSALLLLAEARPPPSSDLATRKRGWLDNRVDWIKPTWDALNELYDYEKDWVKDKWDEMTGKDDDDDKPSKKPSKESEKEKQWKENEAKPPGTEVASKDKKGVRLYWCPKESDECRVKAIPGGAPFASHVKHVEGLICKHLDSKSQLWYKTYNDQWIKASEVKTSGKTKGKKWDSTKEVNDLKHCIFGQQLCIVKEKKKFSSELTDCETLSGPSGTCLDAAKLQKHAKDLKEDKKETGSLIPMVNEPFVHSTTWCIPYRKREGNPPKCSHKMSDGPGIPSVPTSLKYTEKFQEAAGFICY